MAIAPPMTLRTTAARRPAERRARRPGRHQGGEHGDDRHRDPRWPWHQGDGQQRQHRRGRERQEARPGGMAGMGQLAQVDAQLGLGVSGQRVVRSQLFGDMPGQAGPYAFRLIDPR
jgi:hypothetical protein